MRHIVLILINEISLFCQVDLRQITQGSISHPGHTALLPPDPDIVNLQPALPVQKVFYADQPVLIYIKYGKPGIQFFLICLIKRLDLLRIFHVTAFRYACIARLPEKRHGFRAHRLRKFFDIGSKRRPFLQFDIPIYLPSLFGGLQSHLLKPPFFLLRKQALIRLRQDFLQRRRIRFLLCSVCYFPGLFF